MIRKKHVPVFCFDEHNEAFYYWHRARHEGYVQESTDLIHIDAHDDMARPANFSESIYPSEQDPASSLEYYKYFASSQLTIANFILPAVLSKAVRNVYFVYPQWRKFKPRWKKFTICSAFGEGKILKYGVKVKPSTNPLLNKSFPDLTLFNYRTGEAQNLPQNRKVILDIDLDYFACRDSITNHLSYELEICRHQYEERELFYANKTLPFSDIDIELFEQNSRFFARIRRKKIKDHSHLPSLKEIEKEINTLITVLMQKKIRPAVVTICRSCYSGYCPKEMAQIIEPLLLQKLKPLTS